MTQDSEAPISLLLHAHYAGGPRCSKHDCYSGAEVEDKLKRSVLLFLSLLYTEDRQEDGMNETFIFLYIKKNQEETPLAAHQEWPFV